MGVQDLGNEGTRRPVAGLSLSGLRDGIGRGLTRPLQPVVTRLGLSPNVITMVGLGLGFLTAVVIGFRLLVLGGVLVLVAGLFDMLDGAVARGSRRVTLFGGLLDSVVDRLSEAAMLFGLLMSYSPWQESRLEVWLIYLALVGSFMVSYIRARSEGLGLQCKVGVLTRAERVVVLALGLLLNQMLIALGLLIVLTFVTVLQRLLYVRREADRKQRSLAEKEGV